jgi:hypothetical protein
VRLLEQTWRRLGAATALAASAWAPAWAQGNTPAQLERQVEEAFRATLQQPEDAAALARYARLLVQSGNYESGIAALERLLLEPNAAPQLRLEVALLYFRLESYAMAETQAQLALADQRLQGQERATAENLVREVQRRTQRNQFSGAFSAGLRHQTNPAYRSDQAMVMAGGVLVPLPPSQRPSSDNDLSAGVRVQHAYDLETQNSAAIVSTAEAYLVDYRSAKGSTLVANPTTPYDLTVLAATSGVRFKPAPASLQGLTLRPHVLLSYLAAQRHDYYRSAGVGLDVSYRPSEFTLFELTIDGQKREFDERIDVPLASVYDARLFNLWARVHHELRPGHVVSADYAYRRNNTGAAAFDYTTNEVRFSYALAYRAPVGSGNWVTTLWAGALQRDYGGVDATIHPTIVREDRERRLGISQVIPFAARWSALLTLDRVRNNSSLPNFDYANTSFYAGVQRTF